jgi:hypothetical protein
MASEIQPHRRAFFAERMVHPEIHLADCRQQATDYVGWPTLAS